MVNTITPEQCQQQLRDNGQCDLIDVRTPGEFKAVHATPARSVPLDTVSKGDVREGVQTFVICQSGTRAKQACEKLEAAGCTEIYCVEGGTKAWEQANLPVERGSNVISLERQVRIAAGSLVILGVVLAATVNPWCIAISAFVGAGLVFAGVTDTCGMAMLLSKMPWNR